MALAVDRFDLLFNEITKELHHYEDILALIGLFYLGKTVLRSLYLTFKLTKVHLWSKIRGNNLKKYGTWAVITGSSDGIGLGFAHALARRGINLVLISRSKEKLDRVAAELKSSYKIEVLIIAQDFTVQGEGKYNSIWNQIKDKDVGILINNVGVMPVKACYFEDISEKMVNDIVNVNCLPALMLTHKILPQMVQRNRGLVVNISSIAGITPSPFMSVYSASKIFLNYMTDALSYEYSNYNIHFQTITPSYVSTNLLQGTKFKKDSFGIPDALTYAEKTVQTFGYTKETGGILSHDLIAFSMVRAGSWLRNRFAFLLMSNVFGPIKRRADAKSD